MTQEPSRPTVVGIGELLWDLLPDGKQLGGAPANFAYHAQCLGANAVVASCVGDDDLGREILRQLDDNGLDVAHVATDARYPTGTVSVELDAEGVPDFTIHQNVAWDFIPASPELLDLASRADAVCFGSLAQRSPASRETIRRFLDATRAGCLRIFDINLRQAFFDEETIRRSLAASDVLKLNDDELPVVCGMLSIDGDEREMLARLLDEFSLRLVALTRGEKGSVLQTPDARSEHPGFAPDQIADTVGAGDAFGAAVALGLLRGDDLDTISRNANRLASHVCSQPGAMPPVPESLGLGS